MFEAEEVQQLIIAKQIGPLQGFRSKKGFPFAAVVKLSPEIEVKFDFGNEDEAGGEPVVVDFTGKESLGLCPKCKGRVFENGMNYICEKATGAGKTCDFKTGAIILQQPIEPAQVTKLLAEGKTDLLKGFVSNKTKPLSSSVLPSVSSFTTCARSMGCCKMIAPVLKSQVLFGPVAFSQM